MQGMSQAACILMLSCLALSLIMALVFKAETLDCLMN